MSSAVVADGRGDGACDSHEFLEALSLMLRSCDGLVQIVNIRLVMLTMMYLHRRRVDMGFECIMAVRQGC